MSVLLAVNHARVQESSTGRWSSWPVLVDRTASSRETTERQGAAVELSVMLTAMVDTSSSPGRESDRVPRPREPRAAARIVLHAINGIGAGHLARQTALARHLRARQPGLDPVMLGSGPAVDEVCGEVPVIELPSMGRAGRYRGEPAHPDMLTAITAMTHAALTALRPRVVVHDTLVWPTVERAAALLGARQAICLRPRRDLADYLARPDCPLPRMDLVFVPDDPAVHPEFRQRLDEADIPAIWTGPVFRTAASDPAQTRQKLGVSAEDRMVVVMSGGGRGNGAEAREHFDHSFAALSRVAEQGLSVVLVLGPMFRPWVKIPAGFPHRLTVLRGARNLPDVLSAADLVICRGGYGSLHEATAGGARVLANPAQRDFDDQRARVEQFAVHHACELLQSTAPEDLAEQIGRALKAGPVRGLATRPWTESLDQVGERLVQLAHQDGSVPRGLAEQFMYR
ncbi:glycosyltransferase [Streptomyces sp. Y1]|uniref:Glycosyltransferase n=1 Tax=Streptomyces sp. Y1 TaxID=3238634 RepID=A0AB39TVW0_9ACTN